MSALCGTSNGLHVGLILIGDRFDDWTLVELEYSFETAVE